MSHETAPAPGHFWNMLVVATLLVAPSMVAKMYNDFRLKEDESQKRPFQSMLGDLCTVLEAPRELLNLPYGCSVHCTGTVSSFGQSR